MCHNKRYHVEFKYFSTIFKTGLKLYSQIKLKLFFIIIRIMNVKEWWQFFKYIAKFKI